MKKIPLYIICVGIIALLLSACNDDFLERYPKTSIAPESFFNNESDLETYTFNLYDWLPGEGLSYEDASSDNCQAVQTSEFKILMTTANPSSQNIKGGWSWSYLRKVNLFLENYGRAKAPDEAKAHYAGLARFFRAWFYFDKVTRFSDVPWYSKTIGTADADFLYKGRDSRTLVVDSIMADLDYACANIREESSKQWAINKACAIFLKARVALYEGTFRKYHPELNLQNTADHFLNEAKTAALAIMNMGKYGIYSTGNEYGDYYNLFVTDKLEGNKEVILASVYDEAQKRGASMNAFLFNYDFSISKKLCDTYLMKDGTPFTDVAGYDEKTFVEEFVDRDPRMIQTIWGPNLTRFNKPYVPMITPGGNPTGYTQRKFYIDDSKVGWGTQYTDIPVFRYAEILLNYAEARAELGELTQEDLDKTINLIRNRIKMPHMELAYVLANIDPILATDYSNVAGTQKGAVLEIRRERRVELACEGYRFDDVTRWAAGKLFAEDFKGIYFPGLGKYDMDGDDIADIEIVQAIPNPKETGIVYLVVGGDNQLSEGTKGNLIFPKDKKRFEEPKYYYRPVPFHDVQINPNLKQIFGWD